MCLAGGSERAASATEIALNRINATEQFNGRNSVPVQNSPSAKAVSATAEIGIDIMRESGGFEFARRAWIAPVRISWQNEFDAAHDDVAASLCGESGNGDRFQSARRLFSVAVFFRQPYGAPVMLPERSSTSTISVGFSTISGEAESASVIFTLPPQFISVTSTVLLELVTPMVCCFLLSKAEGSPRRISENKSRF